MPLLVVDTQLVDVTQTTTKTIWVKAQKTQQSSKIGSIGLKTLRTVEVYPGWQHVKITNLNGCVLLFVLMQACENMVLND